ncbi:MAG: 1-deoxy-D-xylulose-5-phosphate reductoisomerase [Bacteroidales bacterium]|nr:1-deoxy-D-xylulose-5-phosphate reductoisomerase [Bacteroidales bacterium]
MVKKIAVLGSTGSIGRQTLEVIEEHPDQFSAEILTAGSNAPLLIEQAQKFRPNTVVIADKSKYKEVAEVLQPLDIKVFAGEESITQSVECSDCDMVLTALVGFAGLKPTLAAIRSGKAIALANKETLVVAGELITQEAIQHRCPILPVDSEHSAIFQCLAGELQNPVEKLLLTGSGGPFRGMNREQLQNVTWQQALKHPTWSMGRKITIDSASLMNKGLEVIEAKWLFNVDPENIEVVIHPQSIIHSLVQFSDGAIKAQMGLPSMKLPICYALSYPQRLVSPDPRFEFKNFHQLTFEQPDLNNFRNLALAKEALKQGGNMPCILNAANEIAVYAFLEGKITFLQMSDVVEKCMTSLPYIKEITFDNIFETDAETRARCIEMI